MIKRNFLLALIGKSLRSIISPAHRELPVMPVRSFIRLPIIFDLASLFMQATDYFRLKRIKENFACDDEHHRKVLEYNATVTVNKVFTSTRRYEFLYNVLALPPRDLRNERILIIGPRNRAELLIAWSHGFSWNNIESIDLYSTNPKIQVMNMEEMTWPDESFDDVSMGLTLSYAKSTKKAISEVARVLKPGGRFVFSVSFVPDSQRWKEARVDGQSIANFLHECSFEIEVHQAIHRMTGDGFRQTLHTFMSRKTIKDQIRHDNFSL